MQVPVFSLTAEHNKIRPAIDDAVKRVLDSNHFLLGSELEKFEQEFTDFIGVPFVAGVANGTDAIEIALLALDIGKGDEVIVPNMTAVFTALAVSRTGATPVMADTDEYYTLDAQSVKSKITPKTKAIIPVHLYGGACDMESLNAVAKEHGLYVIEDCAQAHGCRIDGVHVGAFSDISTFSFYPTKNLGALGDAGAISTANPELNEKIRKLRNGGQKDRYHHEFVGVNSRVDELQAAILRVKLEVLEENIQRRIQIAQKYLEAFKNLPVVLPKIRENTLHSFHLFPLLVEDRDNFMIFLKDHGVGSQTHYPISVSNQECYQYLTSSLLPNSEIIATKEVSLPMYPGLTDEEVNYVIEVINEYFKK